MIVSTLTSFISYIHEIWSPLLVFKLLFISILVYILYPRYKYLQQLSKIPGLPSYGLYGAASIIYDNSKRHGKIAIGYKDFIESHPLLNLSKDDRGIYIVWIPMSPTVLVTSPEGIKQLLNNKDTMNKGQAYKIIRQFFGDGIITSSSERWTKHRKLVTPAFHRKILNSVATIVSEQGTILLSRLEDEANKKYDRTINNVSDFIFPMTLDVLCESSMGVKIECQSQPTSRINMILRSLFDVFVDYMISPWMWIKPLFDLSPYGRATWKTYQHYHDFCEKVIVDRMKEIKQEINIDDDYNGESQATRLKEPFMDILLRQHLKSPNDFTLADVQAETNVFVAAGHDTTGWGISYTLYLLGNHLDIQAKVHQEIDSLYGNIVSDGDELTPEILKHFKYIDAVFKESLRLYSPIPVISRIASENVTICDYIIPKGTELMLPIFLIHRNPKYWPQPDKFIPERFLNDSFIHPYSYIPFAGGPRNCIGQKYAEIQTKSILIQIFRQYTVESITPPELIPTFVAPIAVSSIPLKIKLHKRF